MFSLLKISSLLSSIGSWKSVVAVTEINGCLLASSQFSACLIYVVFELILSFYIFYFFFSTRS
jgi:hypothetical protein